MGFELNSQPGIRHHNACYQSHDRPKGVYFKKDRKMSEGLMLFMAGIVHKNALN
jgi:hypothetical protein